MRFEAEAEIKSKDVANALGQCFERRQPQIKDHHGEIVSTHKSLSWVESIEALSDISQDTQLGHANQLDMALWRRLLESGLEEWYRCSWKLLYGVPPLFK